MAASKKDPEPGSFRDMRLIAFLLALSFFYAPTAAARPDFEAAGKSVRELLGARVLNPPCRSRTDGRHTGRAVPKGRASLVLQQRSERVPTAWRDPRGKYSKGS